MSHGFRTVRAITHVAEVSGRLQHWYSQNSKANSLQAVLEPEDTQGRRQPKNELAFLKDWELNQWIERANMEKGIAPCSAVVLQQF